MNDGEPFVDDNGRRVIEFAGRVRNLSRVAELTNSVIEIATSGVWRDYRTALGHDQWRDAEFDYFLIACQLQRDDVARVLAWNAESAKLAPIMDRDAPPEQRRDLSEAAKAWHSPIAGQTLVSLARGLGWASESGRMTASPVPRRARTLAATGLTTDELARRARAERVAADRRAALDVLVDGVLGELRDERERRYVLDRLSLRGDEGRPKLSSEDLRGWRSDADRTGWNAKALADLWGVTVRTAYWRLTRLRSLSPEAGD